MKRNFRVSEPNPAVQAYRGPYQEIAVYVRDLLNCDHALVAIPEKDSIRIQGLAGEEGKEQPHASDRIPRRWTGDRWCGAHA
jgi:hypothetical protein